MKAEPTPSRRLLASMARYSVIAGLLLPATTIAQTNGQRTTPDPLSQIPRVSIPSTIKDGFTFAAVGDLIGPGRSVGPLKDAEFEKVASLLRNADAAFANNEGAIFDIEKFHGYPAAQNGGGDPVGVAAVARDLKAMGLSMVSKANNHATDWGLEGLTETERMLDEAGIVHAGSGRDRISARLPAYLETSKGRIALVSTASTFNPASPAGLATGEAPGRPGISVLRTTRVALVTADQMVALRGLAASFGRTPPADAQQVTVLGQAYRVAEISGLTYEMNPYDHYEILQAIRGAKQTSDLTVFTIHAHETASGSVNDSTPADFLPKLFHNAIDAGADIVVGHGQHFVRGIEIYKGKPIFYGLNSLFYNMGMDRAPTREAFESANLDPASVTYTEYLQARFGGDQTETFESVVAISEFQSGQLKEVRLYPLDLRHAAGTQLRGVPMLASAEIGRKILERIRRQSLQFGTDVRIENGLGIIRVNR